jgi:hypothetical protein
MLGRPHQTKIENHLQNFSLGFERVRPQEVWERGAREVNGVPAASHIARLIFEYQLREADRMIFPARG